MLRVPILRPVEEGLQVVEAGGVLLLKLLQGISGQWILPPVRKNESLERPQAKTVSLTSQTCDYFDPNL